MNQLNSTASWRQMLKDLLDEGEGVLQERRAHEPRSRATVELLGYQSRWDMRRPAVACPSRKLGYRFMAAEPAWIIRGSNRLAEILPYAKHLATFSDDGVHLNGSYGPPFVEQLPYVVEALRSDPNTRQAVATFWRPRPGKWKDVPCTVALQWLLRPDHSTKDITSLHCVATMRSSDAWLGVPYDVATFSALSAYVALLLRDATAKSNERSDLWSDGMFAVRLGTLVLTSGSQHLYQRDYEGARRCLNPDAPDLFDQRPLNLDKFPTPWSLLDHLDRLKDRAPTPYAWLAETARAYPDKATVA